MFSWSTITVVMSGLWVYLKPVLLMLVSSVGEELLEFVGDVVGELAKVDYDDLGDEGKRLEAFLIIKDHLKEKGDSVTDSVINLLIEIAVGRLKVEGDK